MSTLDGPIWSRCSIALTCPARSHFQRTQSRKRQAQGWDERYRSSRKKKNKDKDGQEKRERENKRPILGKLCAALMRSFRGQQSEEMKGSARGNGDPRKSNSHFNPTQTGSGNAPLR